MSFYADPAKASWSLAHRTIAKARILGPVEVRLRMGRIYIGKPEKFFAGTLIGVYTRTAELAPLQQDIFQALTSKGCNQ